MRIEFLSKKAKLAKLFRANGYSVSHETYVYTDKYPTFDLTEFFRNKSIRVEGRRRQEKKVRGAKTKELTRAQVISAELEKKRMDFAMQIAESIHENVRPLYTSKRAGIDRNSRGGWEERDYDAYSKSYGHPAVWKNAGVKVEDGMIRVYTYRSTLAFEMPCPLVKDMQKYTTDGMISGAVYGKKSARGTYKLYDAKGKVVTLAKKMPYPYGESGAHWEHGDTVEKIQREYELKVFLHIEGKKKEAVSKKIARGTALAKRLVNNLVVTYQDARSVGYCEAGVNSFIQAHLNGAREVKISVLKRYSQTERLVNAMCEKVAIQRFAQTEQ